MTSQKFKFVKRHRRAYRNSRAVRAAARGRPRLSVFRSNKHIYAQILDDTKGHTVVSASTLDPALRGSVGGKRPVDVARDVGRLVGERAAKTGCSEVVFDRGGYAYHGRVRALADAAREHGLKF